MNSLLKLRDALAKRREIIADRDFYRRDAEGHLQALKTISEEILEIASTLPDTTDPQLKHFLVKQSYDKALSWLSDYCCKLNT